MRAYKYRLHPTSKQEARLSAWVAAVRAVYNAALDQRKWYAPIGKEKRNTCTDECPYDFIGDRRFNSIRQKKEIGHRKLKGDDELQWITDAPADAFSYALRDLDKAFKNFFDGRAAYPTYRRYGLKRARQTYATYILRRSRIHSFTGSRYAKIWRQHVMRACRT